MLLYDTIISKQYTSGFFFIAMPLFWSINLIYEDKKKPFKQRAKYMMPAAIIYLAFGFGLIHLYEYGDISKLSFRHNIDHDMMPLNSGSFAAIYKEKVYYVDSSELYVMDKDEQHKKKLIPKDQFLYIDGRSTAYADVHIAVNDTGIYYTKYDGIYLYHFSNKKITKVTGVNYNYIYAFDQLIENHKVKKYDYINNKYLDNRVSQFILTRYPYFVKKGDYLFIYDIRDLKKIIKLN